MTDEAPSPIPKIVVIVVAVLTLLYGLICACSGGLGLMGSVTMIATLGDELRMVGIVSAALGGLNVLTCLVLILAGVIALIKRGLGRWLLVAALGLALVVDVVVFGGGILSNVVFLGADILTLIMSSIIGLVFVVIKVVVYLVLMGVVAFLGKQTE